MKPLRLPWLWLGLWLAFVVFVVVASLGPPQSGPDVPNSDKWMHFGTYLLLAATAVQVFRPGQVLLVAAIGLVVLGIGLEVAQGTLTDDRMMDWRDAVANSLGVAVGAATSRLPVRDGLLRVVGRPVG